MRTVVRRAYVLLAPLGPLGDLTLVELRQFNEEVVEASTVAAQMGDFDTAAQAIGQGFRISRELRRRHAALRERAEEMDP